MMTLYDSIIGTRFAQFTIGMLEYWKKGSREETLVVKVASDSTGYGERKRVLSP
jgi:hypothetical protein